MKICMLAPEFIPVWGGVGTYIIELLRHLPKTYEVHVVTPKRESIGNDKTAQQIDPSKYFGSNIKIHYLSTANDTFFYNGRFQIECFKQVPNILKEEKIDVIHTHTAHMPDLLLMFRNLNMPLITTVHSTIEMQRTATKISQNNISNLERSEQATYIAYPILRLSEEIYYRKRRKYIAPSNWMKQWLQLNFHIQENIPVIPNSVDLKDYKVNNFNFLEELFPDRYLADKKIVLFVGRLIALKGAEVLIEAIPNIIKKNGNNKLLFVFVGPGDRERYLSLVRSRGIESSCLFTGPVSRDIVIHLMRNAELLVAPSFIENAPYTVLEAMACGLPIIVNNVGGVSEIVKDGYNGKILESNTSQAVEKAITELLENETLRRQMSQNATKTIRTKFSWTVNLEKYLEVYSSAIR